MKIKTLVTVMALLVGAVSVHADDESSATNYYHPKTHWLDPTSDELYRNIELTLEGFGYGTIPEHTIEHPTASRVHRSSTVGAGVGLSFFFNRYVGIEGEGFSSSTAGNFVDNAGGNLVLRYPIGQSGFAPYVFGGGGHMWDPLSGSYADGGVGVEYRFMHWFGVFVDARYMMTDRVGDFGMGRAGVRFTF